MNASKCGMLEVADRLPPAVTVSYSSGGRFRSGSRARNDVTRRLKASVGSFIAA